ncbi:nucleobase:cation symporter-2 family protein [Spirulina major CS-329]|uniref:uracil-xanthine permease family protein n=1 Tax=Spirulina TaxID=1154 RepID=UPI00232CC50B|nr:MULTISPECIES: nucleobase:cation symporter-2 family protein [Spirulina]MDB9495849.1 nucleobase:cation symporter-2 family protein [Spirulina subsalsa CS-330]MDB9504661.1 nucleobase:cation symporter-2 family protein [Spirulina major CS-329]
MTASNEPTLATESPTEPVQLESDLIYNLEDRPPLIETLFVAFQHVLAIFVGIITPPFIICNALELEGPDTTFIISMSLMISGVATFIQAKRIGPIGSGLLSIQGTSFAFLGPILAAGFAAIGAGKTKEEALAVIFGLCFFGAFVEIFFSRFLHLARQVITPLVTGVVVTTIGLTLIKVGITSVGGGVPALGTESFGSAQNWGLAALVLVVILVLNSFNHPYLRMSAIVVGLAVGYAVAIPMGLVDFGRLSGLTIFTVPIPFRYGLGFSWSAFIPFIFLYLITTIESIGDLTATSAISGEPIQGPVYMRRLKGGVLGDGVNSLIAACFSTFPNTTFSQNNGVIQLTGVGSRYVGYFIAGFLVLLGLFPIVAGVVQIMPQPVLGGATILMFATVAVAGVKILSCVNLTKRNSMILAVSLGLGLGVTFVPEILDNAPDLVKSIFSSGISTGGLSALVLNLVIPGPRE